MINLISEEVYPSPNPTLWITLCELFIAIIARVQSWSLCKHPCAQQKKNLESCNTDMRMYTGQRHTPERWKQGLCLSHISNVASPEINVEDVHQTSLEQLLGTWEVVISYLEFNLGNWELSIKIMFGIIHFDPTHACSSRQFGRTCNLQPIAIAIQQVTV